MWGSSFPSQFGIQLRGSPLRQRAAFGQLDPLAAVAFQALRHTGQALACILLAALELGRLRQRLKQLLAPSLQLPLQLVFRLLLPGQIGLGTLQFVSHAGRFQRHAQDEGVLQLGKLGHCDHRELGDLAGSGDNLQRKGRALQAEGRCR